MKIKIGFDGEYEVGGDHEIHEAKKGEKSKIIFENIEKKNAQKEKTKDKKVK